MNLYYATVPVFRHYLQNLGRWLDKAQEVADSRGFDVEVLMSSRLAPDQFPLLKQVLAAADTAKAAVALLADREVPSHPDVEQNLADARQRIQKVQDYLDTFKDEEFVGAEERTIVRQWMQGKTMRGGDFLDYFVLPNFHFHLSHAYAILRHNGVVLGKVDYVGPIPLK